MSRPATILRVRLTGPDARVAVSGVSNETDGSGAFSPPSVGRRARPCTNSWSAARRLLHDPRFAGVPFLIETEKSLAGARPHLIVPDPLDMRNLETLRSLRQAAPTN